MIDLKDILIGADIELFLKDKQSNEIVSAEGLIRGTKDEPFHYDPNDLGFMTSLDNVAAEFGIPPVNDKESWVRNLKRSMDYINSVLPERLCTVATPAAILADKWLMTDNARLFGCQPDFNAWLRCVNARPDPQNMNPNLRSAGGHIHIGYNVLEFPEDFKPSIDEMIIKWMDVFLAVPSVIQEEDNDRKNLYGKAGAFRPKDYGVEYRTISNYYLQSDRLMEWAYNNTLKAIDAVREERQIDYLADQIQQCINTADKELAKQIIHEFEIETA